MRQPRTSVNKRLHSFTSFKKTLCVGTRLTPHAVIGAVPFWPCSTSRSAYFRRDSPHPEQTTLSPSLGPPHLKVKRLMPVVHETHAGAVVTRHAPATAAHLEGFALRLWHTWRRPAAQGRTAHGIGRPEVRRIEDALGPVRRSSTSSPGRRCCCRRRPQAPRDVFCPPSDHHESNAPPLASIVGRFVHGIHGMTIWPRTGVPRPAIKARKGSGGGSVPSAQRIFPPKIRPSRKLCRFHLRSTSDPVDGRLVVARG